MRRFRYEVRWKEGGEERTMRFKTAQEAHYESDLHREETEVHRITYRIDRLIMLLVLFASMSVVWAGVLLALLPVNGMDVLMLALLAAGCTYAVKGTVKGL